jgi:hypothetical protein
MEVGSMTDPTPLSPAAQAVWNAANNSSAYGPEDCLNEARQIAAAALRAAADQVVPDEPRAPRRGMRPGGTGALSPDEGAEDQRGATRRKLLAIAAELGGRLTLKQQALEALGRFFSTAHTHASEMTQDFDLLRRAVEQLP